MLLNNKNLIHGQKTALIFELSAETFESILGRYLYDLMCSVSRLHEDVQHDVAKQKLVMTTSFDK